MFTSREYPCRIVIISIILFAFIIRLKTLESSPLWFDEAMEFWVATAPLGKLFAAVKVALQDPPFYSLILHFWMKIGETEFALRLLSTYTSLLSISTAFALGKRIHSRDAGIIAALLFGISPPHIRFAQEVGQYAFLVFTLLMNLLMMANARRTNQWKFLIAWIITGLVAVYTYYGSLLIIGPVTGLVLLENVIRRKKKFLLQQTLATFVLLILALPLFVFWLPDQLFRGPTRNAFSLSLGSFATELGVFLTTTRELLAYQFTGHIADPAAWVNLQLAASLLLLLTLLLSLVGLAKSAKHGYFMIWLLASWIVYYAVGRVGAYPYGGFRHSLILTPLLMLAVAMGITTVWRVRSLPGLVLLVSLVAVAIVSPREAPEDLRMIADQYLAKRQQNTPTYVYYGAVPGFGYQLRLRSAMDEELPALWYLECWGGTSKSYCVEDNIYYGRWIRQLSPVEKGNEILLVVGSTTAEFWLIFSHTTTIEQDEVMAVFKERYDVVDAIEAVGASAYLLQSR